MFKVVAVLLVFFGEALSIVAELLASKRLGGEGASFFSVFWPMFLLITLGGACLVAGYMLGYIHLKNIWIVAALSVGSILVVEPILAVFLFGQAPTLGAIIGLVFGGLGMLAALLIP